MAPIPDDPDYDPGLSPSYSTRLPAEAARPDMMEGPVLAWAQRSAGLSAVLAGLTGVFLTMAIIGFSSEDRWGTANVRGLPVNAWPFLGGGLMLGVTLAVAVAIFVFAYRLTGSPRAGRGVFVGAAVLFVVLALILAFAPDLLFGAEGSAEDRDQASRIGTSLTLAAGSFAGLAAVLTTRVLRRGRGASGRDDIGARPS
jgi:hypothetical protein